MTEDDEVLKYKLKTLLKDNVLEVSFTKINGEERNMKCTLKPTLLPEHTGESKKTFPEDVLPVWDLEENAWRSFRIQNVHDYIVVSHKG